MPIMREVSRILLIKEGEWWIAQGLELNITVQCRYLGELADKIVEAVESTMAICRAEGVEWQTRLFGTTPAKYFALYETATPIKHHIDGRLSALLGPEVELEDADIRMYEVRDDARELAAC